MSPANQIIWFCFFVITISCNRLETKKPSKIEINQRFEQGKVYYYEIERGKTDASQPGIENLTALKKVTLNILGKKNNLLECSWKYEATELGGSDTNSLDEQTRVMLNFLKGFEVKFTIDETGSFHGLTNFEECKKRIEKDYETMFNSFSNESTTHQLDEFLEKIKCTYETEETLINTFCPDLSLFFSMFGQTVERDSVYVTYAELSNPFKGPGFPTKVSIKLDGISGDEASIIMDQQIPEKDLNRIMKETCMNMSNGSDKPFKEDEIPKVNLNAKSVFTYNFKDKFLTRVYSEKLIQINDKKQTQWIEVNLKKSEPITINKLLYGRVPRTGYPTFLQNGAYLKKK